MNSTTIYPYPLRNDTKPRMVSAFGLCSCSPGACCSGHVVAGQLPNGDRCRCAIPLGQRPFEHATVALQRIASSHLQR
jgi:hypothetical protein